MTTAQNETPVVIDLPAGAPQQTHGIPPQAGKGSDTRQKTNTDLHNNKRKKL